LTGNPLRIAMLSVHSSPLGPVGTRETGGMSVYIRELARELGRRGHRIDIFTRRQEPSQAAIEPFASNVRLIHLAASVSGDAGKSSLYPHLDEFLGGIERFRSAEVLGYDLIHSHYWISGRLGSRLRQLWRRPHLLMYHSLGEMKNRSGARPPEPDLRIAAERDLARSVDRILAPTDREKHNLIRYYGAMPERIGVVPCGVDLELFRPLPKGDARRQLGLDPEAPLLLYVGRFEAAKGLDLLLLALARFGRNRRLRLLVVGGDGADAPEAQAFKREARELGLGDRVLFAGRIDQRRLPAYYAAADFLVVPSRYESFGLVALEALACGRPVLATPVGVMEELLRGTHHGLVVDNASPEALARGMRIMSNGFAPSPPADLRAAVADFRWSAVAAAVLAEYAELPATGASAGSGPPLPPTVQP